MAARGIAAKRFSGDGTRIGNFFPALAEGQPRVLKAYVRGSALQVKVWQALLRIPSGELTTYGKVAEDIGHPKPARAVGSAIGSNAIAYLIPCHRVIRKTGAFSSYRWGAERKRVIIAQESARRNDR